MRVTYYSHPASLPLPTTERVDNEILSESEKLHIEYYTLDPNIRKICFQYVGIAETISEIFRTERNNLQHPSPELQRILDIIAGFRDIVYTVNLSNTDLNEVIEPENDKPYANPAIYKFTRISKCLPNITHMNLFSTNSGDFRSMGALAMQFRKLQYINLGNTQFNYRHPIIELLKLPYLRVIDFTGCNQPNEFTFASEPLNISKLKEQAPHIEIIN